MKEKVEILVEEAKRLNKIKESILKTVESAEII